jgi:hypothetical protein
MSATASRLVKWPAEGCLFGAVCAAVVPRCACQVSIEAINKHLAQTSGRMRRRQGFALLILDGAGWYGSPRLVVPNNIVVLPLPPCAPAQLGRKHLRLHNTRRGSPCLECPDGQIRGHHLNWNQRLGKGQNLGQLV